MNSSIFHRQGQKATPEWSGCFEHGISQITDWFWKLDDVANTDDFEARFGRRRASYFGLLVVGRSLALSGPRERQRWDWRRQKVIVNSLPIIHVTYDELCEDLLARLEGNVPTTRAPPASPHPRRERIHDSRDVRSESSLGLIEESLFHSLPSQAKSSLADAVRLYCPRPARPPHAAATLAYFQNLPQNWNN